MKKHDTDDLFSLEEAAEAPFGQDKSHPDALTPDEILKTDNSISSSHSALEALRKKITTVGGEASAKEEEKPKEEPKKSLLDKCLPYIIDDDGNDTSVNEKPLYQLKSVAEILNEDSRRTLEKLSKEYGVVFEDRDIAQQYIPEPKPIAEEPVIEEPVKVTPADEEKSDIPVISDIDIPDSPFYKPESKDTAVTGGTVTFTPITDNEEKGAKILVSTHTKPIDFTGELLKVTETEHSQAEEVRLEESEFEEYNPRLEYTDAPSGKKLLKKLAREKKIAVISMWGSIALTLLSCLFLLPVLSDLILSQTTACMGIVTALALICAALNYKALFGLSKIFTSKADSDVLVSLSTLCVLAYSVLGIVKGEIILNTVITLQLTLTCNSLKKFMEASAILRSFKQIFHSFDKNGIALINDPAITMAMTKGAVEGDCLIAAPQSTAKIDDFMKHYTFGKFLNGRVNIITAIALVTAVLTGFLSTVAFGGISEGLYSASAVLLFTVLPSLLLIDALPIYHSAKKLALRGAMIAGKTGAELVEQANAVVLNAKDIFPSGTVTMHKMEILSENNLEDTIIRAASLTEAMGSPLAPIFKRIAGTGNITGLPDSDTVKYEEALGISGWVDNRLLFIGNRTLMEAHGITVPDVELDRKILRQGYFPVYVADQSKACALIVVRYEADHRISKELRRLTAGGVTLLVKTSDPNLTAEMICDYLGLYEDSVKIMTAAGCHICVNTVTYSKNLSAPAAFKSSPLALPTILNCADRIKRSNILLTAVYIITAIFGLLLFAYTSFGGSGTVLSDTALLLYSSLSGVASYLLYLTQKP